MEHGKFLEVGTFEQLAKKHGVYAEFVEQNLMPDKNGKLILSAYQIRLQAYFGPFYRPNDCSATFGQRRVSSLVLPCRTDIRNWLLSELANSPGNRPELALMTFRYPKWSSKGTILPGSTAFGTKAGISLSGFRLSDSLRPP